jgi:deoxyribonuclease-4
MDALTAQVSAKLGPGRIRALHLNDSQTPMGSNRDRHANIGTGEIGEDGCAAFLAAPAFDDLPCVLETPGPNKEGPDRPEVELAVTLRKRGVAARSRAGARPS